MNDKQALDDTIMAQSLVAVAQLAAMIPLEELAQYVSKIERQKQSFESFGFIVDPTAYMHKDTNPQYQDALNQLEIAKAILALIHAIHKREAFASQVRGE